MTDLTQQEKVFTLMCDGKWHLPADFMQSNLGELFVGYEASARFSELAKLYPDAIESRPEGKYIQRRLRTERVNHWYHLLTRDLQKIVEAKFNYYGQDPAPETEPAVPENTKLFDMPPTKPRQVM